MRPNSRRNATTTEVAPGAGSSRASTQSTSPSRSVRCMSRGILPATGSPTLTAGRLDTEPHPAQPQPACRRCQRLTTPPRLAMYSRASGDTSTDGGVPGGGATDATGLLFGSHWPHMGASLNVEWTPRHLPMTACRGRSRSRRSSPPRACRKMHGRARWPEAASR